MAGGGQFRLDELEGLMLPDDPSVAARWQQQEALNWQQQQLQLQQQLLEDRQLYQRQLLPSTPRARAQGLQQQYSHQSASGGLPLGLDGMVGHRFSPVQQPFEQFDLGQRPTRINSQAGNMGLQPTQLDGLGMGGVQNFNVQSPFSEASFGQGPELHSLMQPMLDQPHTTPVLNLNFQDLAIGSPHSAQGMFPPQFPSTPVQRSMPAVVPPRDNVTVIPDLLVICNQPAPFGRFRYKSEQRERPLEADKGYPECQINPKYHKLVPPGTPITVRLVTKTVDERGECMAHFHELAGNTEMAASGTDRKAMFDNLTVLMSKQTGHTDSSVARRNKEDQRAVRLRFECYFNSQGSTFYGVATSQPVFNAKLIINKLSHAFGPATGQNEIVLLCSKVRKGTTTVCLSDAMLQTDGRLFTPQDVAAIKSDTAQWRMEPGTNMGICVLPVRYLAFHHQYAIVVEMPPHHNASTSEPVRIHIQIVDFEDGTESPPVMYTYIPSDDVRQARTQETKKRRMDEGMREFWQQFQQEPGRRTESSG